MNYFRKEGRLKRLCGWRALLLMLLGLVIGLLLVAGGVTVMHKTSDTAFCVSCHSMERPLAEYQGSVHFENHAGIRAECADCHVPTAPVPYLLTKIAAVKDIYGEITGKIDTEEKYDAHKLAMAESVWKTMKANDSATCRSCHSFEAMDILAQRPEARKAHPVAIKENQTCIDCHRGVAHILPDMTSSNAAGASQLAALTTDVKPADSPLYSIKTQSFVLEPGITNSAGTLFPSAPVIPLRHQGSLTEARLEGWQQDGVTGVIYGAPGRRIIRAVLDENSQQQLKTLGSQTDSQTDTQWHHVALTAWFPSEVLIANQQKIWQYASDLMSANCTGCHGLTALDHFTANQWIGVMKGMASRTALNEEQLRILTLYAQNHASDMPPAGQPSEQGSSREK